MPLNLAGFELDAGDPRARAATLLERAREAADHGLDAQPRLGGWQARRGGDRARRPERARAALAGARLFDRFERLGDGRAACASVARARGRLSGCSVVVECGAP